VGVGVAVTINFSYPKDRLREETINLAKMMAKSPAALRYMKQILDEKSYRPGCDNFKRTRARVDSLPLAGWVNPRKAKDVVDVAG
jgi:hypothetical protein